MLRPAAEHSQQPPPAPTYYTLCRDPMAEARVTQDLSRLATGIDSEVGDALRALFLVGAFARGEGGVIERDGEPCAAEPGYQLLALVKRHAERHHRALETIAAAWSRLLRARVNIRAFALREVRAVPATRFWYHVGEGQFVTLLGDAALLRAVPRLEAAALHWDESALALCEGLTALALATLESHADTALEIDGMHRAVLACTDALLLRRAQYPATLSQRADTLRRVQASAAMRGANADAAAFLERPDRWTREHADPRAWLESTRAWLADQQLHHEAERVGTDRDLLRYVSHARPIHVSPAAPRPRFPLPDLLWRPRDPIERLMRCSSALAFGAHLPACRRRAAALLHLPQRSTSEATGNAALAQGLRTLAQAALPESLAQPFSSLFYLQRA